MKKQAMDLTEGPLFIRIVRYTVPIILTGILQLLFNAADLVVVGQFCGNISVAAVGATSTIINLIVNTFIGLSVGVGVRVAHGIGAKDDKDIHKTVHTAIPTALISGTFLTVVGLLFSNRFLAWMGTPEDVIELSSLYMSIYFCGVTSSLLYNFGAAILRAVGDTKRPLYYLLSAGIINVGLNLIFVCLLDMNVAGVALATTISQTISAVLIIWALTKRKDSCKLSIRKMRIYKNSLIRILQIGVPAGIQNALFSISNVLIQSSVNSFGSVAVSGNSAAVSLESFIYTSMNAFNQTALNFIGQNYGAKKYNRIGKILWCCLGCVCVVGILGGGSFYLMGRQLLSIYITDSEQAISYGLIRMLYICVPYFLCGMMDVTTGAIRGFGSSVVPMVITVLGACGFRIVWIYTVFALPAHHTLDWLYVSYPISWLLTFAAQVTAFIIISKKKKKKRKIIEMEKAIS